MNTSKATNLLCYENNGNNINDTNFCINNRKQCIK